MARFARGSAPWLLAPVTVAVALVAYGLQSQDVWPFVVAVLPLLVFAFFVVFFRDPERAASEGIASPADGRVSFIDEVDDPDLGRVQRFSIFMSPKDVHVNRYPVDGTVAAVRHKPGGHVPAFNKEAERNERVETLLDTAHGRIKVIQIAGTVARRIVPYHQAGDAAVKGERFGLIRLGSRCDILVAPGTVRWDVQPGTQVYAGTTSLGAFL